jgi:hypothetical protein
MSVMILHMKMKAIINEWGECKVMDRVDNTFRLSKTSKITEDKAKEEEIHELRTRVEQLERILFAKRHGWVYTPEMLFK